MSHPLQENPAPLPADHWRISQLNLEIERLEANASELAADLPRFRAQAVRAGRRLRYLRAARSTRIPSASFELWKIGVLTAGPVAIGLMALFASSLILPPSVSGLMIFFVAAGVGGALLALLLFYPADGLLADQLQSAASEAAALRARADEAAAELLRIRREQERVSEERRELMASGQVQRAALLQRDWKLMNEAEWEDFVVEACRTLGATVERHPPAVKLPPVLLIRFANRTAAAITRASGQVVDSSAVNQALLVRENHQLDGAAVIINRRFTGAAQDLARHRGCQLIGLEEFPDFVLGKLQI
ncbi:MAG: hypothetical protein IT424_00110 [Pirellulales bacterium]|nr:hypothetical protein [Pirellulales bacterium]